MDEIGSVLLEPDPDGKPGQRRIRPAEWPDPDWVDVGVRGDLSELDDAPVVDRRVVGRGRGDEVHRRRRHRDGSPDGDRRPASS